MYYEASDKTSMAEKWKTHDRRKKEAMSMKESDMKCARESEEKKRTATFDLQATLYIPHAGDCQIYYSRKLSIFNFTIYDSNGDGYCYVWDETEGKKGSSEI